MKKTVIILFAVLAGIVLFKLSSDKIASFFKGGSAPKQSAPSVLVEEVGETDLIREFEAPGRVVSKYQVGVLARISGYLQASYFKEGDSVKKGQSLFLIEQTEYRNAVNATSASVKNIKAQLNYAEKQLARAKELVAQDYIAKAKYDEILANRDALKAQLSSAQAQYADAVRNMSYTVVKAPVDGKIGLITVTVGNYVSPSSGNLTTINSNNPIYVTFPIESADFNSLVQSDGNVNNRKVELSFANGKTYKYSGVQDFNDNKVDQTTGTVTMRATFENPDEELIHGEFVTVKLFANKPSRVPVVPVVAVQENQEGRYVYKVDDAGLPQLTYIKTSGQQGDKWVVSEGINVGDRIVTDGLQKVMPGKPVKPVSKEEMEKIKKQIEEESKSSENQKK